MFSNLKSAFEATKSSTKMNCHDNSRVRSKEHVQFPESLLLPENRIPESPEPSRGCGGGRSANVKLNEREELSPKPGVSSVNESRECHGPCHCHNCATYYWNYYQSYFRQYDASPYHTHYDSYMQFKSMGPSYEIPSLGRRVSVPSEMEQIDNPDKEVEMITKRSRYEDRDHFHHHARSHSRTHHHYSYHRPHEYCYPPSHYYPHDPYHHYNGYHGSYPTPYHHAPQPNIARRKRKRYDEYLLRPKRDFIIHAGRSESPMSDITASPTPSLSDFGLPEETEESKELKVETDAALVEFAPKVPTLKRRRSNNTFDFAHEGDFDLLRAVSPLKDKLSDNTSPKNEKSKSIWREEETTLIIPPITNNVSQTS